jgi:hypothetical protein
MLWWFGLEMGYENSADAMAVLSSLYDLHHKVDGVVYAISDASPTFELRGKSLCQVVRLSSGELANASNSDRLASWHEYVVDNKKSNNYASDYSEMMVAHLDRVIKLGLQKSKVTVIDQGVGSDLSVHSFVYDLCRIYGVDIPGMDLRKSVK